MMGILYVLTSTKRQNITMKLCVFWFLPDCWFKGGGLVQTGSSAVGPKSAVSRNPGSQPINSWECWESLNDLPCEYRVTLLSRRP